jgi:hypothetical protein
MNLRQFANGNQVLGRGIEHAQEFSTCVLEAAEFKKSAAERDTGRQICRVLCETRLADPDGFFTVARPAILFGELRKRNRRRILLNPASKVFNPRVVRHVYSLDRYPEPNANFVLDPHSGLAREARQA